MASALSYLGSPVLSGVGVGVRIDGGVDVGSTTVDSPVEGEVECDVSILGVTTEVVGAGVVTDISEQPKRKKARAVTTRKSEVIFALVFIFLQKYPPQIRE